MTKYNEQAYRWVNLSLYLLAALVNSLPVQAFSSITVDFSLMYDIDVIFVQANVLIFPLVHPLVAFPANWLLDKKGVHFSCAVGGMILIGGVWLRWYMITQGSLYMICGSILAAIGNIFVLNSPSKLLTNWFKTDTLPIVFFGAVLVNLISITLGAVLPGFFLFRRSFESPSKVEQFFMIESIIVTVPIILMIIFLRQKPTTPPSRAAAIQKKDDDAQQQQNSYPAILKSLFKNSQYKKIMLAMCFVYGTQTALLANLNFIIQYNHLNTSTALIILIAMLAGIIGTIVFSIKLRKTNQYRHLSLICCFGCFGGVFFLFFNFSLLDIYLTNILFAAIAGFFMIPSTSMLVMYATQVTFPISQGSTTGYLFAASQTFGAIVGFILALLQHTILPLGIMTVCTVLFSFSIIACYKTQEDLKKLRYDLMKSVQSENALHHGYQPHFNNIYIPPNNVPYIPPYNVPPYNVPPYNAPPYNVPPYNVPPYNVPPYNVPQMQPDRPNPYCNSKEQQSLVKHQ